MKKKSRQNVKEGFVKKKRQWYRIFLLERVLHESDTSNKVSSVNKEMNENSYCDDDLKQEIWMVIAKVYMSFHTSYLSSTPLHPTPTYSTLLYSLWERQPKLSLY